MGLRQPAQQRSPVRPGLVQTLMKPVARMGKVLIICQKPSNSVCFVFQLCFLPYALYIAGFASPPSVMLNPIV